jgi:hypothetical protein
MGRKFKSLKNSFSSSSSRMLESMRVNPVQTHIGMPGSLPESTRVWIHSRLGQSEPILLTPM